MNQVQKDGSLFQMPVQIAVHYKDGKTQMEILNVDKKTNEFILKVTSEPKETVLDPEHWVLMDADFKKKRYGANTISF
ncbi:MAG: hypothetical protein P8O16_14740 [Algoriphagus sp.]|uniref:hypothetical protein n=1 Tax=Algoriphagus sp. TaxID=1872435 RepID=UPI00261BE894|nr:hypothetical protein [Algoriphagus sp.]MDG1278538.1 hypothetical protein [Algoriphagus sp.]